ncbi:MAG: SH3 domain-containing protein [Rhodothermales bacterium]
MIRRLFTALVLVISISTFSASTGSAQDAVVKVQQLRGRVDSLAAFKATLQQQIDAVNTELASAEALLQLHQLEEVDTESVVLLTNMDASLRSRPSPDGRVIRLLPQKTPLIATDFNGAYWKVRYEGLEGWVMRLFLDEGEGAASLKQKLAAERVSKGDQSQMGRDQLAEDRLGKRFLVTEFGIHPPNSAGGVSIYYAFEHLDSTRTVREVTFSITPYNNEGLKEKGMNSGASTKRLRRFGPISVHDGEKQYQFENVWYNAAIQCAEIDRVDIVYTDGSRASHRQEVGSIMSAGIENDCTLTAADQIIMSPDNE